MADYGFEVTNDNGVAQVVDTAPSLNLHSKFYALNGSLVFDDIFALRPSEGVVVNTTRHEVDMNAVDPSGEGKKPLEKLVGNGTVITFRLGLPKTSHGFGLEVFSELGEFQFSSSVKVLRVLDVIRLDNIFSNKQTIDGRETYWRKNYGDKEVAVIVMQMPVWAGYRTNIHTTGFVKRGSWFCIEQGTYATNIPGYLIEDALKTQLLIVDVTGY